VKGFKLREDKQEIRETIKLTDDILFQGLNSEDMMRAY